VREAGWAVVVPVKRLASAKSRLRGAIPGVPHERLALALVLDTVAAARACGSVTTVVVVTGDTVAAEALRAYGARIVPEPPGAGLNAALAHGAGVAAGAEHPVAALTADLPALRPAELADVLRSAANRAGRAYVTDTGGTGTTLLAASPGVPLDPHFGAGSGQAHARSGARLLAGAGATVRRDVDTADDLFAAAALGLGPNTSAAVGGRRYGAGMQGTVATYDEETRSGTLLLDDGSELSFPPAAFEASGLRLLRLGQRVRVEHDAEGRVVRVTLPTL
jgi:2-phospho-L-lactate guanylyltransferase